MTDQRGYSVFGGNWHSRVVVPRIEYKIETMTSTEEFQKRINDMLLAGWKLNSFSSSYMAIMQTRAYEVVFVRDLPPEGEL